jgi:hypothetical protein
MVAVAKYGLALMGNDGFPPQERIGRRDVGENVFLSDLSDEYHVFALYYPSAMRDEALEAGLSGLGELTGKNVFVNIGKLNDPSYEKIRKAFEIQTYPVVVVTATADLAAVGGGGSSVYVRIDDGRVLADTARAVQLVQEVSMLFLGGEVADAIAKSKSQERKELLRALGSRIGSALQKVAGFVADRDFKISLVQGSFEITKSA